MEGNRNRVCQICNRSFSNGKAMGGHMRSHFTKPQLPTHISTPSSSSSSPHPHTISHRLTPQSRPDRLIPFGKDSGPPSHYGLERNITKPGSGCQEINNKRGREYPDEVVESPAESGQGSLASDITFSDEEGAMCLMMLSMDTWPSGESETGESRDYGDSDDREDNESICQIQARARNKGRFKCETCNKEFGSYQALGGHRAGHKKVKLHRKKDEVLLEDGGGDNYGSAGNGNNNDGCSHKIFECRYCGKVFESRQALGGHNKVHVHLSGNSPIRSAAASSSKCKVTRKLVRSSLIDLNQLPDPETNNDESKSKSFHCIKRRIF